MEKKSLSEVESLTENMTQLTRKLFGIKRRIPDTTMRDSLVQVEYDDLRKILHQSVKDAVRRKSLPPIGLPCGVAAMDGKWSSTNIDDNAYTQHHSEGANGKPIEQLRTITSCLISSKTKVCLDAFLIPPQTNEKGIFRKAFDDLIKTYPALFEIITYDAGANSEENARYVNDKGFGYVFALKGDQGTLFDEAKRVLGELRAEEALAITRETVGGKQSIRRLWKTTEMASYNGWDHLQVVFRVQSVVINEANKNIESIEDRYFITNVRIGRMTDAQWLLVIRLHWCVENNCHNIFDRILREDDRVWIREPQGMLAIQLLRRIAFNLMALFRGVTQRSKKKRETPWKELMESFYLAFVRFAKNNIVKGSNLERVFATIC